jgi:hypothetical protein
LPRAASTCASAIAKAWRGSIRSLFGTPFVQRELGERHAAFEQRPRLVHRPADLQRLFVMAPRFLQLAVGPCDLRELE